MKKYYYIIFLIALCSIVGCDSPEAGGGTISPDATETYIIDAVLCTSIEANKPANITNIFLPGERINLWVHWANVRIRQTVTVEWYDPDSYKVSEYSITFQGREDRQISICYIDTQRTSKTGEWLVKIYLDDIFMRSYLFSIN